MTRLQRWLRQRPLRRQRLLNPLLIAMIVISSVVFGATLLAPWLARVSTVILSPSVEVNSAEEFSGLAPSLDGGMVSPLRSPMPSEPLSHQSMIWAPEPVVPLTGDLSRLAPDIRRIVERGRLIVALPANDAFPFFYHTGAEDSLAGLDIQIARSVAAYLGVEVTFDRSSPTFDAVIDQVFDGNADLAIAKISRTLARGRRIRYSRPYVNLRPGLLFNRLALSRLIDFNVHQSAVDMIRHLGPEAHLGVIRASSYANFARSAFPDAQITEYANWEALIDAIIHGRVLAGCRDELAIKYEMLMQPQANVQMQSAVIEGWLDEISVVLPWDSEHLNAFFNQYLSETSLSFTADQLLTEFLYDARQSGLSWLKLPN